MSNFIPKVCEHCNQTTETELPIDKGSALLVLAIAQAQQVLGKKYVHLDQEVQVISDEANLYSLAMKGKCTPSMRRNASRPRYHGLIAFGADSGSYLLTKKGADFLNGEPIWKTTIIDKTTKSNKGYIKEDGTVTFDELIKSSEIPFWDGEQAKIRSLAAYHQNSLKNPTLL